MGATTPRTTAPKTTPTAIQSCLSVAALPTKVHFMGEASVSPACPKNKTKSLFSPHRHCASSFFFYSKNPCALLGMFCQGVHLLVAQHKEATGHNDGGAQQRVPVRQHVP